MIIRNVIPKSEIHNKRWLFSLPVKSITPWTLPVYLAVAHLKSARSRGAPLHRQLARLTSVLSTAAAAGDCRAHDAMLNAEKTLRVSKSRKIRDILATYPRIHNQGKRGVTMDVIDAVDFLQEKNGRLPTRAEIVMAVGGNMSDREISRQIERVGWRGYL